jgi:hypothetical protein
VVVVVLVMFNILKSNNSIFVWSLIYFDEHQNIKSVNLTDDGSVSFLPIQVQHNTFVEIL